MNEIDEEVVDYDRSTEVAKMADSVIAEIDEQRARDEEDAFAAIERQLADIERESMG